jgi:hypothetical protein
MRIRRRVHDESGFTLAELIIALALETIIFGALATAFVVVLHGGSSVNENLQKSSDARFAAAYLVSDARNSSGPEISLVDTTSCPDPNPPVVGTQTAVARFNWNAPNEAGTTSANISNYVLVDGSLLRRHCEAGVLLGDGVLATSVAALTVVCSPNSDCSGSPTAITVAITETPDTVGGTPYKYSLTAAFRKLIGGGSSLTPSPPQSLVVFGSGGCGVSITGAGTMKVHGNAFINTADSGSCRALSLDNSGAFSAGGTSILAGGTCVAGGASVCPAVTPYSPAITDPYSGLVPPTTTGRPAQTGCSGPQASQTAQPGVYAGAFSVQGGNTCTLASGIYILQAGFDLGNGAIVSSAAGGVLIYITGGAFAVGGGAALSLTAATTGTYAGLAVWQSAADTSTISFSNGGAIVFRGALYAPKAELNIGGNAQTPIASSILVQTVVITNSGGISIGASAVALSIAAPASLAAWTVNRPYPSTTLTPSGGDGNYSWSATGLPNGMAINAGTGVISGSPTVVAAPASVVVTLNDALGDDSDSQTYSLTINGALSIGTTSLPSGETTLAYTTTLTRAGGTGAYTWAVTNLPAGLTYSATTGVISGTPTAVSAPSVGITVTDVAGATATKSLTLTVTAAPAISLVTIANGTGTAGTITAGDTVSVVFSAQMNVSKFCSTWSGDTYNQTLNGLSDVTVSVANATHDTLSVTSLTCTFNFGSLNLGSAAYVSVAATFKGSTTSTRSTIAWTAATHTLVITLGAKTAGTVANVATSTPIYTASAVISDAAGALLSNSPFTSTAGKKF